MSDIQVSIICNAYNQEKYIRDALEGFIKQRTSFLYEILVHDDASTDGTADIIREYEQKRPDLIKPVYQKENQYHKRDGTIKRLQAERAQGKYVAICEGDDYWIDPLKLQKQYDFMEANPEYTLCGCSTKWENCLNGKVEKRCMTKEDRDVTFEEFLLPPNGRPFPMCSFFMKKEIWKDRPEWGFPVGDLPQTYYAAMQGKVRMLADLMCVYRWFTEGSWTARKNSDEDRVPTHEAMIRGLENMNRETGYVYDELIRRRIRSQSYALALMKHDFAAIQSQELIDIYRERDFLHRLSDRLRCQTPGFYRILQRIIGKE